MATTARDAHLDADLLGAQRSERRKTLVLVGAIGLIGLMSAAGSATEIVSGEVPVESLKVVALQGTNGILGLAAAALLFLCPRVGWSLALAWALVQIPFYAWTPVGSPNALFVSLPITMSESVRQNGVLTSYSAIGINLAGVIFAVWLRAWRWRFGA